MRSSPSTRRQFLKVGAGSTMLLPLFARSTFARLAPQRSLADGAADPVLVVVELSGGNDGLNTVVPFRDDRYRRARPTLALDAATVLRLDDDHGLHPALRGLVPVHEAGGLVVVQSVGYGDPDRSHFRSRDIWHTARQEPEGVNAGWLGRAVEHFPASTDLSALVVGQSDVPLLLRGLDRQPPALRDFESAVPPDLHTAEGARRRAAFAGLGRTGVERLDFLRGAVSRAGEQAARLERALSGGLGTKVASSALGEKLGTVAGLITSDSGCRVYYVSQGGYDTHAAQGPTHRDLLQELGDALGGFQERLREHGRERQVVTFVFSEFGRRVEENRSRGTDHGAGAPCFLLGLRPTEAVQGGPVLDDLLEGDVRPRLDFRRIASTLLARWPEVPREELLGGRFAPLDGVA